MTDHAQQVLDENAALRAKLKTLGQDFTEKMLYVGQLERTNADLVAERDRLKETLSHGELWSFIRKILEQGTAIQQDYQAGKYESYEHYSARMDEAARERADQFEAALRGGGGVGWL